MIIITLLRPDGGEIRLANIAVTAPRPGEEAPYRRYFDTPERVLLTQEDTAEQSIQQWFAAEYPDAPVTANLDNQLNAAFFGVPARMARRIESLQGNTMRADPVSGRRSG